MRKSVAALWAVLLLGISWPGLSWSALAGNSIRLDYLYPTLGDSLGSVIFVAPFANLPYVCCLSDEFSPIGSMLLISVSDDTIVIVGDRSQVFSPAAFNGLSFLDALGTIEPIIGATLVQSTLPGLDAGDIGFSADQVLIDFAGADGSNLASWRVAVRLSFDDGGGGVPEPGTLALAAGALIGLGGLGCASRRAASGRRRVAA